MLFGGNGTFCFPKETSRDYEIEKPLLFLKIFSEQPQSVTPERRPKRAKTIPFMARLTFID